MVNKTKSNKKVSQNFWTQSFVIRLAVLIGKVLPRKFGLKLASFIGACLGKNKKSPMVKAIRANQWVVHQQSLTDNALDEMPVKVFKSAAKCMFDYFYFLNRPEKLREVVDFSPEAQAAINRINSNQPSVVVCPHISNFDLMGYALTLKGVKIQVLSYPDPKGTYKMQNKLREAVGINVTPLSFSAFRQARVRLNEGGSILTGLDRPVTTQQKENYQPEFFGYTCSLPVFYIRMAKEADAPVFIMAATSQPNGRYRLEGSPPIWIEPHEDLDTEIRLNANRVLKEVEPIIKQNAHQWAMFYPVWPRFLGV